MVGVGEARLRGRTVRSSVVVIHQQQRVAADGAAAEVEDDDKERKVGLDVSSSTDATAGTALDASGGGQSSRSSSPSSPGRVVINEPSSSKSLSLASLEEEAKNRAKGGKGTKEKDEAAAPQASRPSPSRAAPKKAVSFHIVEVREYPRTLGDHPDTMAGPPITLAWEYCDPSGGRPLDVEEYERERGPRRTKTQLIVHPDVRRGWLTEGRSASMPLTEGEIKAAEKEVHRAQLRRRNSAAFYPLTGPVEEVVQSLRRKLKRGSWRSKDDAWWEVQQKQEKLE